VVGQVVTRGRPKGGVVCVVWVCVCSGGKVGRQAGSRVCAGGLCEMLQVVVVVAVVVKWQCVQCQACLCV